MRRHHPSCIASQQRHLWVLTLGVRNDSQLMHHEPTVRVAPCECLLTVRVSSR
jgi:hypothetical protein